MQDWKEDVSRLVLCTGKVYYDIQRHPERAAADEAAVVRIEQLYRFPTEEVAAVVASYPELRQVVWVQEEPQNMGAWRSIRHRLESMMPPGVALRYEGRPWRASTAEGYAARPPARAGPHRPRRARPAGRGVDP